MSLTTGREMRVEGAPLSPHVVSGSPEPAGVALRRPARQRVPRTRPIVWLSGRALLLHLIVALAVPMCLFAAWWQFHRALSGNTLSFVYVFEWPAFAGIAVWAWWVLLTLPSRDPAPGTPAASPAEVASGDVAPAPVVRGSGGAELLEVRRVPVRWDAASESANLRAYNAYLADIAARRPRGRLPRRPRRAGG